MFQDMWGRFFSGVRHAVRNSVEMGVTFLHYLKHTLLITGIVPYDMLTCNKTRYKLFRNTSHVFYLFLLTFMYLEFPYIWNDSEKFIESLNLITTYTVLAIKMFICRNTNFGGLMCDMVAVEQQTVASRDDKVLNIYKRYVKRAKYIQLFNIFVYVASAVVYSAPYILKYLILYKIKEQVDGEERKLPFYMWMPFDKKNHYLLAFAINLYFLFITCIYYSTVPVVIIVLLLYTSFRLKVLGCLLKNIKIYMSKFKENDENITVEAVIRYCVLEHLKIIQITNTLNNCLRNVTLLEFIVLSAQIALIAFEGFTSRSANTVVVCIVHVLLLLVHMLLFYWHADEIRHESMAISEALYESDWYEYSRTTSSTIHIMMMRSQRPLSLSVGPFGEMSLTMALKILKGVYTYMTFLQHSYGQTSSLGTN